MQKVLTRTTIGIAIAILINGLAYTTQQGETNKEILVLLGANAAVCSIPVILNYALSYSLINNYNGFTYTINILLLILNIFLLIAAPLLILVFGGYFPITFLGFTYLTVGYYVLYETVKETGNAKRNKTSRDDILDDNL